MQIEDFIRPYAEKLQIFKKNVFTLKHALDFLQKLCERNDIEKMESELTKCLLNTSANKENEERRNFLTNFIEAFKKFSSENTVVSQKIQDSEKIDINSINSSLIKIDKDDPWGGKKTGKDNFTIQRKFKIKNKEEEFPTLENWELVSRKKNFEILDHHYMNKIEKGNKICFCMSSKHPLVGNCLECGRIQCLQEGDSECIVCGASLLKKDDYMKQCSVDKEMKKAYLHKEKLLKFQAEFYSKMQIIDDFSDWYEISNNTWISKENRELAKKKDDEIDRIRDNPEFEYNINFKTLEITKVYEENNEAKMHEDITNLFMENQKKQLKKEMTGSQNIQCRGITENAIEQFNQMFRDKQKKYQESIKSLSKIVDLESKDQIGQQMGSFEDLQKSFSLLKENDNFPLNESIMCLSMHQPWASLLIEGFKRFEGREWDSDFRGVLWIHATSKKPDQDLIDSVENECRQLYCKDGKSSLKHNFPQKYPTSCLLGCVDVVDVVKRETYVKLIPHELQERTDSKFLFICKNPKKLEIPIKMPGQPNIYKLDESILERTKGKLVKVSTNWWPTSDLYPNLFEIPFTHLNKYESIIKKKQKQSNQNKVKLINLMDPPHQNNLILIQHFLSKESKDNILTFIDSIKRDFQQHSDNYKSPYINIGLSTKLEEGINKINKSSPVYEIFKEIQNYFQEEKKLKMCIELREILVEYIDWYGNQNFNLCEENLLKVFIGNSLIFNAINDPLDNQGKNMKFDCGDILFIKKGMIYAINQVLYDTLHHKMKQGVIILTFKLI
jgi:hypothetical protein